MDQPINQPLLWATFAEPVDLDSVFASEARSGRPRRNPVHAGLFEGSLGVESAYWLGFIYADGSVAYKPRWCVSVSLASRDEAHVHALQAVLGGRVAATKAGAVRLMVHSKELCRSLAKRGVVPRKSYVPVEPPALGDEPGRAFLRGLFDGNGCLHRTKRGHLQAAFCGHPAVVEWFCRQVAVPTNGAPRVRGGAAYAQWTSSGRAASLAQLLYDAPGPRLARKAQLAVGASQ